jgi:cobalamin biosynthetic protein CobC
MLNLRQTAADSGMARADWLDLTTGINPHAWPLPPLSAASWQRLPEINDGLEAAAAAYYGNHNLLPVAGSQAAIRVLPTLMPRAVVACLSPLPARHPQAWQSAGHRLRFLQYTQLPRALAAATPYLLFCNPHNPTGELHPRELAVDAAKQLEKRGGWLIVDESLIDPTPAASLASLAGTPEAPNLIVFRSLSKFFGLAGARVGFVLATPEILRKMAAALGPWTIAGPAREAARLALQDSRWQALTCDQLKLASERLQAMLAPFGEVGGGALFATLSSADNGGLQRFLARHGILTRIFESPAVLRISPPGNEADWQRLHNALKAWKPA